MHIKILFFILSSIIAGPAKTNCMDIIYQLTIQKKEFTDLQRMHKLMSRERPPFKNAQEETAYDQQLYQLSTKIIQMSKSLEKTHRAALRH